MPNRIHGVIASVGTGLALLRGQGAASSARTLADMVRASAIAIPCGGDQPVAPTHGAIVTHERCRGTLQRAPVGANLVFALVIPIHPIRAITRIAPTVA